MKLYQKSLKTSVNQVSQHNIRRDELTCKIQLVYYNDVPVGSVCCRIENDKVYIMIMEVLAPYRRQGLGAYMLNHIINVTKSNNKLNKIYLHVQKGNDGE